MEQAKFTALRDIRIVSSDNRYIAIFEEGQTRSIPQPLHKPAIEAGLIPDTKDLTEIINKVEADVSEDDVPDAGYRDEEHKERQLVAAAKELIGQGNPNNFTAMGKLRAASVKPLVNFDFTAKEVQEAYDQALFEVNNVDDKNEEHS